MVDGKGAAELMRGRIIAQSFVTAAVACGLLCGQIATAEAAPTPTPSPTNTSKSVAASPVKTPTTVAEAKAQLKKLEDQQAVIGEDFDQAQAALSDGKHKVEAVKKQVADQQDAVDKLTKQVRAIALRDFQGRSIDTTVQVFTSSDPEAFLNKLSTVNKVDQNMNDTLQSQQLEQAKLDSMKRDLDAQVAALSEDEQHAADLDAQIKQKVDEAQAVVDQLTAEQQAALAAAEAAEAAASAEIAKSYEHESNSDPSKPKSSKSDGSGAGEASGDADSRALGAVRYALSKVGNSSYVWGAAGPHSFDCSGLMMAAYRSVGISLPHSSSAQSHVGRAVSKSELKPGDLLFWYSPIHHVSMYIGNGKMVHAANSRADLRIDSVAGYGAHFSGARRIVG